MRTYFSSTFIEKEVLNEAGIYYPIKLDYYKIINEEEINKQEKAKFGIHVVKTKYKQNDTKVENKKIPYVSDDEETIENILQILKENVVTPIAVEDILQDFTKEIILW